VPVNDQASEDWTAASSPQRIGPMADTRDGGVAFTTTHWSIVLAAQSRLQIRHLAKLLSLWQLPSLSSCHNCIVSLILVAL
jgi:hypothetical protein